MAENFFAQFHDQPTDAAPSGDVVAAPGDKTNYFTRFHPEAEGGRGGTITIPGQDGKPARVIMDMGTKPPDRGTADAIGRGVASGATAGFSDELRGLIEAGGANPDEPASVYNLLHGALRYWSGDEDAKKHYEETVKRERDANLAAADNHPIAHGVGEVGGVLATLPFLGGASGAPTWTARALAAAKQGAAYGGLSGAGEGEGAADTAVKAGTGAVLGGVIGGVAAPLIEGAGQGARYLWNKGANIVRGATNPEGEAARQYLQIFKADREADPTFAQRMSPAEFHANPEAAMVDLGAGGVRRLADVAAITSPAAQTRLKTFLDDRAKGQFNRFSDWFNSNFHYPNAYAQKQALDQVEKNVNSAAYKTAYAAGDRPLISPGLEQLTGSNAVTEAMKRAVKSGGDRAITEDLGAFRPGVNITPDGRVVFNKGPTGVPAYPNLQFWDQTRRKLSDMASEAARQGRNDEADVLGKLARRMNAELDGLVPEYQTARQGAAGFFGAENALDAGKAFVRDNKISLGEARDRLANMTPAERRLFQDGFVSEYVENVLGNMADRRDILQKIADSPKARAKLELVLGRDKLNELEAKIRVEGIFNEVRQAVQGNSWTAKRLYDLGLAGGAGIGGHGVYSTDPKEVATGAIVAAIASKGKSINVQVANKLVDMMLSRDPVIVQKAFKAISGNSAIMDALRDADTKIGRVFSNFIPSSEGPSAAGVARADDKNGVPGPVQK